MPSLMDFLVPPQFGGNPVDPLLQNQLGNQALINFGLSLLGPPTREVGGNTILDFGGALQRGFGAAQGTVNQGLTQDAALRAQKEELELRRALQALREQAEERMGRTEERLQEQASRPAPPPKLVFREQGDDVVAFDPITGEEVARNKGEAKKDHGRPLVYKKDGPNVVGFDPFTGEVRTQFAFSQDDEGGGGADATKPLDADDVAREIREIATAILGRAYPGIPPSPRQVEEATRQAREIFLSVTPPSLLPKELAPDFVPPGARPASPPPVPEDAPASEGGSGSSYPNGFFEGARSALARGVSEGKVISHAESVLGRKLTEEERRRILGGG